MRGHGAWSREKVQACLPGGGREGSWQETDANLHAA